MKVHGFFGLKSVFAGLAVVFAGMGAAAQDTRTVTEPAFPPTCTVLTSQMAIVGVGPASELTPDTARIQAALTACAVGKAVELAGGGGNYAFLTAPLNIPSGVSLIVDGGVTLFASRNREDYQTAAISSTVDECGTDGSNGNGCKNLFSFNNGGTNANSGLYGYGVIDGRGYATTLKAGADTGVSWWQNADNYGAGQSQNNPIMMKFSKSTNFTLYKITLRNSPEFHVGWAGMGFTAWGVKIQAPFTAHNTDGIDPDGTNVTITNSSISDGDDNVAVGASSAASNITVSNVTTYSGHGISVGSYTQGGLQNFLVTNVNMAGTGADGNATGIRLKSAQDRGGLLNNITYQNMCLKDMRHILQFTPFYNSNSGTLIPQFTNVTLQNLHFLTPSAGAYAYQVALQGHDASHLSTITLNNVVFDSLLQTNVTSTAPEYETFTLGPGSVYPAFLQSLSGTGVSYVGSAPATQTGAFDCTAATTFPYEVGELYLSTAAATNLQTASITSGTTVTLNAMLQPAMATQTYNGTAGNYTGAAAMTKPVNFLEGSIVVGTGTLGANGTLATLTLSGVQVGTHTYTAQYPGDTNYMALAFGKVTVVVSASTAASTTTGLTVSSATSVYGAATTLTAAVSTATGTPTGSVTFLDGTATLATVGLTGTSATTTQVLGGGVHSITAVYSGDANFATSTSTAGSVTVSTATTSAATVATPTTLVLGASTSLAVTLKAVGSGSNPTGTVTVTEGSTTVGSGPVNGAGVATISITPATVATHSYLATYSGDPNYAAVASTAVLVTVTQAIPTVVTTVNPTTIAPGAQAVFTVTVTGPNGAAIPTGQAQFFNGTQALPFGTLDATGKFSTSFGFTVQGAKTITAVYSGDTNYAAGTSAAVAVTQNLDATTTTLTTTATSVTYPAQVGITSTVSVASGPLPTGLVQVTDNAASLNAFALANGAFTSPISLGGGTHVLTAAYLGDLASAASASAPVTVTVAKAATAVVANLSTTLTTPGSSVVVTATVGGVVGGVYPTGAVTVFDGTVQVGSGTITATPQVAITVPLTTIGAHSLSVQYSGDANYNAAISAAATVSVAAPFVVSPSQASVSLAAGAAQTIGITITPGGGFTGTVNFACASPVTYVTCTIFPAAISVPGTAAVSTAATITVAATYGSMERGPLSEGRRIWLAMLLPLGTFAFLRRRKGWARGLLGMVVFAGLLAGSGCSSAGSVAPAAHLPPPGTQVMTVTASSGALSAMTTISVVVTN